MADIFKKFDADGKRVELDATDDADVITKHMTACSHAVLQICLLYTSPSPRD